MAKPSNLLLCGVCYFIIGITLKVDKLNLFVVVIIKLNVKKHAEHRESELLRRILTVKLGKIMSKLKSTKYSKSQEV